MHKEAIAVAVAGRIGEVKTFGLTPNEPTEDTASAVMQTMSRVNGPETMVMLPCGPVPT